MERWQQILQLALSGLSTGAIYGLIGLGFAIIHNATAIVNFAQGEFVMLGGMLTLFFLQVAGLPLWLARPAAILTTMLVGIVFEHLAIRPLRSATPLRLVIITIGGSILIRGIAMLLWDKDTHSLPPFSGSDPINIGGATILPQNLWIFALTIVIIVANRLYFSYSISGRAMRACAHNRRAASLVGIDVRRMVLFSFALSASIGSLAGIAVAPLTMTSYDVGIMLGLKGFCAAIIGGMSSGMGTVVGGLVLGLLESFGAGFVSSAYRDAIAFVILLLILILRPQGLFSRGDTDRV
ncbi:MAG TPA: branched-chain amino acid ABC transporter permease [Geobacterales bacterium]|nr:branched-chain amino acid ABC transporter permease [Geobacterales bacterium]